MSVHTAPLAAIAIGERDREEMGDIAGLAESITAVGLLHPVVVTEALTLVAGGRRLEAAKHLGWTEVPVTVVETIHQLFTAVDIACGWNHDRRLTPYEAAVIREQRIRALRRWTDRDIPTALYRLYDVADALLYVGISNDPERRFGQHSSEKWWWPDVARPEVMWFATRGDAEHAEAVAIRNESPLHNIVRPVAALDGAHRELQGATA